MMSPIVLISRNLQMYAFVLLYMADRAVTFMRRACVRGVSLDNARDLNNAIVVAGAEKAGYKVTRLPDGFLQISDGDIKHYSRSADFDFEGLIAWQLSGNKYVSQMIMESEGLPVPKCICVSRKQLARAFEFLQGSESAVVTKPLGSCSGKGVVTSIRTQGELVRGFAYSLTYSHGKILIEQHIAGMNYRINVLDGKVISVIERTPASVTGDGTTSIRRLVEAKNRAIKGKSSMQIRPIPLDLTTRRHLRKQNLTLESVPGRAQTVYLRDVCNADQGGEIRDVTETTDNSYIKLAVTAAASVGVRFCGVDVITGDIQKPAVETGCVINEINTTPALYVVDAPNTSREADIGEILMKRIFGRE